MRLFLAVKPDRQAEALLGRRLLQVQDAVGSLAAHLRWTPAENIHITLHFLGELGEKPAADLRERLGVALRVPPFAVAIEGLGTFPPTGSPRLVWLDVSEGREALERVHEELGRRIAQAGLSLEPRPLSPHVTIARVPERARAHAKSLRDRLRAIPDARIAWHADSVVLFRSDLSGPVPRYEAVQSLALGGEAP